MTEVMVDTRTKPGSTLRNDVTVLFWSPTAAAASDEASFHAWANDGREPIRVLLRADTLAAFEAGEAAHRAKVEVQAILSVPMTVPSWVKRWVVLPDAKKADVLALALSDGVLDVAGRAGDSGKMRWTLGAARPDAPVPGLIRTSGMDPVARWLSRHVFSLVEKGLMAFFGFRRQPAGAQGETYARSWKTLRRGLGTFSDQSYFGPAVWSELCPDRSVDTGITNAMLAFDRLDVLAGIGANLHRGLIWAGHLLGVAAVFAAVAGVLSHGHDEVWTELELVLLVLIGGLTVWLIRGHIQQRWTACRLAAEQLRIARMSLPLLVVPPALSTPDHTNGVPDFPATATEAINLVKRSIRNDGLPHIVQPMTPAMAAAWLRLIVNDQAGYHASNSVELHIVEGRLHKVASVTFFFALGAVLVHLLEGRVSHWTLWPALFAAGCVVAALDLYGKLGWRTAIVSGRHALRRVAIILAGLGLLYALADSHLLLLATAVGPALAAALHGIGTRLGLTHRHAESKEVLDRLNAIRIRLDQGTGDLEAVRDLARASADAMDVENQRWHGLLRRQHDSLPA